MSWWKRLLRGGDQGGPGAADLAIADEQLLRAARDGDLDGARNALAAGARVDARTKGDEEITYARGQARYTVSVASGATALSLAARAGRLELVKLLLEKGAAVNAEGRDGDRALSLAAAGGHAETATLLLDRSAELEAGNRYGVNALHSAASYGHPQVVQLLLDRGARADVRTRSGATAVGTALNNGHPKVVQLLLEKGATLTEKQVPAWAPMAQRLERARKEAERLRPIDAELMQACMAGDAPGAQRLLAEGARPDEPDKFGSTPLAVAALKGHLEVVRVLLAGGADPLATGKKGITALHRAAESGAERIVEALLERAARPGCPMDDGNTPLHLAAGSGSVPSVDALIRAGADVRAADSKGRSPLHVAAARGDVALIERLLAAGADVNAGDGGGGRALHEAAGSGSARAVGALIRAGADVRVVSSSGRNPLHRAANAEVGRALLAAGLDANARDRNGEAPLHIAATAGKLDVVELLVERGAEVDARSAARETPAFLAARRDHQDVVRLLAAHGADVTSLPAPARPLANREVIIIDDITRPRAPAPPELLSVTCAGCQRAYTVGRDAILVTMDLALQQLDAVVRLSSGDQGSSSVPDLVEAADAVPAERRAAALAQAEETARPVVAALNAGRTRRWKCNRCQHVNDYPVRAAPSKPPAVGLMECPPYSGPGLCSDDACPCSSTAIPPAKGYLYLSPELCDLRKDCLGRADAEARWRRMAEQADPLQRLQLITRKILFPVLVCEQGARLRGLDLEVAAADYDSWMKTSRVPCRPTPVKGR